MNTHGKTWTILTAAGMTAAFAMLAPPQTARAEGLLESIFGGLGSAFQPPPRSSNIRLDRVPDAGTYQNRDRSPDRVAEHSRGPSKVYCVRTCDGHYFPVAAHAGLSAAQACQVFCPASEPQLYRGVTIDSAVARDGRRYTDLPNAFAYRKHLVAGCTCNGRTTFGLAPINPLNDPTLQPGDVVATRGGLVAFAGNKDGKPDFTPVKDYSHFSKQYREQLSTIEVAPNTPRSAPGEFTPAASLPSDNRTAQLER